LLKLKNPADWNRIRVQLKGISGVSVTELDKQIKVFSDKQNEKQDHLAIARSVVQKLGSENILYTKHAFWVWNENKGIWDCVDDKVLGQEVHSVMEDVFPDLPVVAGQSNGVVDILKTVCFKRDHEFNVTSNSINCLNGELIYTSSKWELMPHAREHFFTWQIPIEYDDAAEAKQFGEFLLDVFRDDAERKKKAILVLELMGYTLVSNCDFQKFVMLIGRGANGKSVLLAIVELLVGIGNAAAVKPSDFGASHKRAYLKGKLANIVTELKQGAPIDEDALKSIVSGDATTVDEKYGHPFTLHPFCTCWFATNHLPNMRDFSDGTFRRAKVIKFNRVYKEDEQDRFLTDKLRKELPGIFRLALKYFGKVLDRNEFTKVTEVDDSGENWRFQFDEVAQFVKGKCVRGPKHSIPSAEIYEKYKEWATANGINKQLPHNTLTSRLLGLGATRKGTNKGRLLEGIKMRRRAKSAR
jgi:putative DNA primase/helicase